jgi:hypothetical protein
VSEAQWWLRSAQLAGRRIHDGDDPRSSVFSSRQIDARQLIVALWQLLMAEKLQQVALRALQIDRDVYADLSRARQRSEQAMPGIKHVRDALMHFDEWARGEGGGPQRKDVRAGKALRDVAGLYWGFSYNPAADTITLGPYVIHVDTAVSAAAALADGIYQAARAVDQQNVADLRERVVSAIIAADLPFGSNDSIIMVSQGNDTRVWVSLNFTTEGYDRRTITEQTITALAAQNIVLVSSEGTSSNAAECLRSGEALRAAPANRPPGRRSGDTSSRGHAD